MSIQLYHVFTCVFFKCSCTNLCTSSLSPSYPNFNTIPPSFGAGITDRISNGRVKMDLGTTRVSAIERSDLRELGTIQCRISKRDSFKGRMPETQSVPVVEYRFDGAGSAIASFVVASRTAASAALADSGALFKAVE